MPCIRRGVVCETQQEVTVVDRAKLEADLNTKWSFAIGVVRAHSKSAIAVALIISVLIDRLILAFIF